MRMKTAVGAALCLGLLACGDDGGGSGVESVTLRIGPNGGTVELSGGGKVTIPAGALSTTEMIKITKLEEGNVPALPDNLEPAGKPYAFEPHGLTFAQDIKIEVPYEGSDMDVRPMKRPNEMGDTSEWTTVFPSEKDMTAKHVSFDTRSFSVIWAARPRRSSGVVTLPDGAIVEDSGTPSDGGMDAEVIEDAGMDATTTLDAGMDAMTMPDAGMDAMTTPDAGMDAMTMPDAAADGGTNAANGYIKASNAAADEYFGNRLALDGNTLVVGAMSEDSNATGVNGDQSNNSASASGAVYVYIRGDNGWVQEAYLKASNTQTGDNFGHSVAISGDTIVVGAPMEDSNANVVNGNESDNSASACGAAYVFVRNGATWTQQAYLKPANARVDLGFGTSVAIDGGTIVVGAPYEDSNATGINGNAADTSLASAGAAYVFTRNGTTWAQDAYLKASNTGAGDEFGGAVAIGGNTIVVGAIREDSDATGVNGDGANNNANDSGAAYVFTGNPGSWNFDTYLKASNTGAGDVFGWSVATNGIVIVVGAPSEDSNATGVNGDGANNLADLSGAAYVFGNNEGDWEPAVYLKASNTGVSDQFGTAVSVDYDVIAVGAQGERSNATGLDGDQTNNDEGNAGAAYVFRGSDVNYYPRTWDFVHYVKASNTEASDGFGVTLDISLNTIAIGASGEDSGATGVGGDESDNSVSNSGAVYAIDFVLRELIEDCTDGYDDDGDGATDCADSECVGTYACVPGCEPPAPSAPLDAQSEGIVSDGLVLWLRGDVGVALDDASLVCSWEDQSGANHHFSTTNPSGVAQMVNGLPAIDFVGGQGLSRPGVLGIASTSGRTIFVMAQSTDLTARSVMFAQGFATDNSEWIELEQNTFNTVGQRFSSYMTGNAYDSNVSTDLLPHVHTLLIDTMTVGLPVLSVMHQRVDGTLTTLTRTPGGTGNGLVESFVRADTSFVGLTGRTRIAEVIVYDRALDATEIAQVEAYLTARYTQ